MGEVDNIVLWVREAPTDWPSTLRGILSPGLRGATFPLSCEQGHGLRASFSFSQDFRGGSLLGCICNAVQSSLFVCYA
jgi:hypothetical protein